jgi:phospholipid/cholesterol/gamma-HCH transport system substrate-binding protein
MINRLPLRRLAVSASVVMVVATGCAFNGVNSLPLPGAVGRGSGAQSFHVEIANVATLEPNSPVLIDDVVIGSVAKITVSNWHAVVDVSVEPGVVVPGNAVASVGQTSLLGSMHVELNPPVGRKPEGRLMSGATIPLNKSSTYPSTEQTLSSLSVVLNGGGLGQIGDVVHNFNAAFSGRQPQIRDLLTRLDTFVGTIDTNRDNIVATIQALNRLSGTVARDDAVLDKALRTIPPALEVLVRERPRITTALEHLGTFSDTATGVVNDAQADLVKNLQNLEPTLRGLADVGPPLDRAIAFAPLFPYGQNLLDRGVRGDYVNLFVSIDLTIPRLKRTLFLGTRFGQQGAPLVPAPGDPLFQQYTYDPLGVGIAPPAPEAAPDATPPAAGNVTPGTPPPSGIPPAPIDQTVPSVDPTGPPAGPLPGPAAPAEGVG